MIEEEAAEAWFVADLHLRADEPERLRRFVAWLPGLGTRGHLFVLGDLFDAWVGAKNLRVEGFRPALDALAAAAAGGLRVVVIHGNRDFLLDGTFEKRTGALVAGDACRVRLGRRRALLLHGDTLCTRDRAYLRYRRVVRSPPVRAIARTLPLGLALAVAGGLRGRSRAALAGKPAQTTALDVEEGLRLAEEAGCEALMCGHVHAPSVRVGRGRVLLVLPAWGEGGLGARFRDGRGLSLVSESGEESPVEGFGP